MSSVLVTRPHPDADELAASLREKKFKVILDPLFTTEFALSPPKKKNYQALLATSRNAIRALMKTGAAANFLSLPLFAVGEETELAARNAGFKKLHVADYSALSLSELVYKTCAPARGPLLYLAGKLRKQMLEKELTARGFDIRVWEGYAMHPSPALRDTTLAAFRQKDVDAVLLFSEQASLHFLQLSEPLDAAVMAHPAYICLSRQVATPLLQKGLNAIAPQTPRLHAMIELLNAKNH